MAKGGSQFFAATALKMALVMVCACTFQQGCFAQQLQQIQAVVDGILSPQQAAQANAPLLELPGVHMSRLDQRTSNLFMHVEEGSPVDATVISDVLGQFGMSVRCFRRNIAGAEPFKHLDPQGCGTPPLHR